MSNNLNEHKINKQFTDKAWANMQARLDEAMPVNKGWGAIKWLVLGIVCILFTAGYWLANHISNKKHADTATVTKFVETKANASKTPNLLNEKQNTITQQANKGISKLNEKIKPFKPAKNTRTTNNVADKKEAFPLKKNTSEKPVADKKNKETLRNIANLNNPVSLKKKSSYLNHSTANSIIKQSNLNVYTRKKITSKTANNSNSNEIKNIVKEKASETKPSTISTNKADNIKFKRASQVNNIRQIHRSISKSKDDTQLIHNPKLNQSKASSVSQKLLPQNQDGRFAHKTINYGIKLGLSSDLTSESGFKVGALVDFNFSNKFYLEFCTAYRYGAINKKIKVQYDTIKTMRIKNPVYINPDDQGEVSLGSEENPEYIFEDITVKDTISTVYKTNQHNIDVDLMLAYKITQNLQALIGVSATKKFNISSENNFLQSNEIYNTQNNDPYTTLEYGPKIALRFKLKNHLLLETSYQYNMKPIVENEFQVDSASRTAFKNPYQSKKLGLGFVYKF